MNVYQKSVLWIVLAVYVIFSIVACVKVHIQSTKEIQPGCFIGTIVDKGEEQGRSTYRSTYRWIIADWVTKDGENLGRREVNASGLPINQLKIGDTITSEASSDGLFVFWEK